MVRAPSRHLLLRSAAMVVALILSAPAVAAEPAPTAAETKAAEALKQANMKARQLDAIGPAETVLRLRRKRLGNQHPETIKALQEVARLASSIGDMARALETAEEAYNLLKKSRGNSHPETGHAANFLAVVYLNSGDHPRANRLLKESLAISKKQHGPDSDIYAGDLQRIAGILVMQHAYTRAEPLYRKSLAILEKKYGRDNILAASPLWGLGNLYIMRGDKNSATKTFGRLLGINEKQFGKNDVKQLPQIRFAIGSYLERAGAHKRAKELWNTAERGFSAHLRELASKPKNDVMRLSAMWQHGNVLQKLERHEEAAALFEEYIAIQRAQKIDAFALAANLYSLAMSYRDLGKYKRAIEVLKEIEAIHKKRLSPYHATTPANIMSSIYHEIGDFKQAERLITRIQKLAEKSLGKDSHPVALYGERVAVLRLANGDTRGAIAELERTYGIEDRFLAMVLAGGTERDNRAYMTTKAHQLSLAITAHTRYAPKSKRAINLALSTVLSRKGRMLDAAATSVRQLRASRGSNARLFRQLSAARTAVARLVIAGPTNGQEKAYRRRLAELEQRVQKLEARARALSVSSGVGLAQVSLASVRKRLPKGAVLVEFVRHSLYDPTDPETSWSATDPKRYTAYVLHPSGKVGWVDLGAAGPVESAVNKFRIAVGDPKRNAAIPGEALYKLVMAPLEKQIGSARHLIIAPDASLHLIPFGALVDRNGKALLERFTLTNLTTGRDLMAMTATAGKSAAPLIIGDPDFDGASSSNREQKSRGRRARQLRDVSWGRLPGTAAESAAISKKLARARLLIGKKATERGIKQARSPRILHVATHGFFLPRPKNDPDPVRGENPLLRSGLVFAGANKLSSDGDDGYLTALEAAGLNLAGTELVVLSACETGVGAVSAGEGVYGLRRALTIAGARHLVMSLWQVDDAATRDLMIGYYERLAAGEGRSEALRSVQLKLLRSKRYRHPYYWASFIAAGNWKPLPR